MDYTFSQEFIDTHWQDFKESRLEVLKKKGKSKQYTEKGERLALKRLWQYTQGDEEHAVQILEYAIEEGWESFHYQEKIQGEKEKRRWPETPEDWWFQKNSHDINLTQQANKYYASKGWMKVRPEGSTVYVWKKAS